MTGAHRHPSRTTRSIRRIALSGATVAAGSIAALGVTGGIANATTTPPPPSDTAATAGGSTSGPSSSLVDLSHNQTPIQVCHNQVPVNVLGVQVPVQDATGALGIAALGSGSHTPATADSSCHLPAAQGN
jgi:hypothetical protein